MSIANAAHCSMMGGSTKNVGRSFYTSTASKGFYRLGLGSMPYPTTFLCWYKFSGANPPYGLDKMVLKYGDSSSGVGFGMYATNPVSSKAFLCEAKYWASFQNSDALDVAWHHLAIIIKSGTYPAKQSVYLDGVLLTPLSSNYQSIKAPRNCFNICGRDVNQYESSATGVSVYHPHTYAGALTLSQIEADMAKRDDLSDIGNMSHCWDCTKVGTEFVDFAGNWNLTTDDGKIVNETPFG